MLRRFVLLFALPLAVNAAAPWQQITMSTAAQAAAAWPKPPAEYSAIHWAIWGGPQARDRIAADIERAAANGAGVYMINNSRGLQPKYFSPEYLDLVKFAVGEAKRHGMKVWIEDEAGYPDGMAGGMISEKYPQLGMQGLVADARYTVAAGQTLKIPLPPDTLGILAYNRSTRQSTIVPLPADGQVQWTAPNPGLNDLVFVRHVYRSSPTRYTNRADGTADKDSLYSLTDYLDPEATRAYLGLIHETYAKILGDEFGKTILGFRGDEPDYTGFMPWSPKLLETFRREKGYDLQPFLAQFFGVELSPEAQRAKADYWDVWSAMFRDNFFLPQVEWCHAHGLEYMVHLNHEELMLDLARGEDLIRNEGSFFRAMRHVDVPGIDNLNQIGPGIVADFPKLAADAAHVYGHPHVWTEQGGGLGQAGKFVADYEFVRGVNFMNMRGLNGGAGTAAPPLIDAPAATAGYVSRTGYLLALGRPAAQVALFHPTDSMWLGDQEADTVVVKLTTELMEHQVDFDALDTDAIASVCALEGGGLKNLSGGVYRAVIVPTSTAIAKKMLDRLRAFAAAGGKVIFVGRTPSLVYDRSFLQADTHAPDLSFATVLEPAAEITPRVLAALPRDVQLDSACAPLKYLHRALADSEVYFFFNESDEPQARIATLVGTGDVQEWDATRGTIHPLARVAKATGRATVPLGLAPHEARIVVVGPLPPGAGALVPAGAANEAVASLEGDWALALGDKKLTTALVSWEKLGVDSFNGIAEYRKTFAAPAVSAGRAVFLDLGNVSEVARVQLNGKDLAARPWAPFVWDVSGALQPGENTLVVQVQVPLATRGLG
ncbi:MAG TPA: glycosyl hydrolase, partial [Opitutaceae bacterium]|nr:glycosyl hydrolase [Opitutaceae bacterium]